MNAGERIAAVTLIVLGLAAMLLSLGLGVNRPVMPGAGLFPFLAALALGASSAVWLVQRSRAVPEAPARAPAEGPPRVERGAGRAAALVVAMAVFAILFKRIGFLISGVLLMSFTAYVTGERRWLWILGVAVAGSWAIGLLFSTLGAQLP